MGEQIASGQGPQPPQAQMVPVPALTKTQLIKLLKKESPRKKSFKHYQIVVEQKRVSVNAGLIRLEVHTDGKEEFVGAFYLPLGAPNPTHPSPWDTLKVGKSHVFGLVVDSREQSFVEKAKGFLNRSIEEGKLQEFIPSLFGKR